MLSSEELAGMRAAQEAVMDLVCTIRRKVRVDDGIGGRRVSWTDAAVGVACRIGNVGRMPEERVIAERLVDVVPYAVVLAAGTDVTADDRIVVTSTPSLPPPEGGGDIERVFEVVGVLRGSFETARRCVCVEVIDE